MSHKTSKKRILELELMEREKNCLAHEWQQIITNQKRLRSETVKVNNKLKNFIFFEE